jgi:hypothetical protein
LYHILRLCRRTTPVKHDREWVSWHINGYCTEYKINNIYVLSLDILLLLILRCIVLHVNYVKSTLYMSLLFVESLRNYKALWSNLICELLDNIITYIFILMRSALTIEYTTVYVTYFCNTNAIMFIVSINKFNFRISKSNYIQQKNNFSANKKKKKKIQLRNIFDCKTHLRYFVFLN